MRKLLWVIPAAFFFLNPGVACDPGGPEFQYGAAEMRAAVEGDWSVTITPTGGAANTYTIHLMQAPLPASAARAPRRALVRAAHACGTRTLVSSAGACIDITEMPLRVTGDQAANVTPTATYRVIGLTFTTGDLDLVIDGYHVSAQIKPDGTVTTASVAPGGPSGAATMMRRPSP